MKLADGSSRATRGSVSIRDGEEVGWVDITPREFQEATLTIEPGGPYGVAGVTSVTMQLADGGRAPHFRVHSLVRRTDGAVSLILDAPLNSEILVETSEDCRT